MQQRERVRRLSANVILMALVLGAGGLRHTHADHDGRLAHVDEQHGPHGTVAVSEADQRPASVQLSIPAGDVVTVRMEPCLAGARCSPTPADRPVRPVGHDPPRLNGSRAPPLR